MDRPDRDVRRRRPASHCPPPATACCKPAQAFRDMSQGPPHRKDRADPPRGARPRGHGVDHRRYRDAGRGVRRASGHPLRHRHLLLVSRSGPDRCRGRRTATTLGRAGRPGHYQPPAIPATPPQLAALLDTIPASHPLTAVIHAAGVLDDAVISELTREQLDAVLGRQSRRRLASASPHRRPRPGRVRLVLLGRGNTGQPRAGQLRGRQRLPGRAGPPPPSPPTPGHQPGLGLLANPSRHDRPPQHARA